MGGNMYLSTTAKQGLLLAGGALIAVAAVVTFSHPAASPARSATANSNPAISGDPEPVARDAAMGYAAASSQPLLPPNGGVAPAVPAPATVRPVTDRRVYYSAPVRRRATARRRVYYRRRYRRNRPFSHSA